MTGPLRRVLEGAAWSIPLRTGRLFLVSAVTVAGALAASGVAAAWVSSHNATTISEARQSGLGLASATAEFGTRLTAYDAEASTMLLTGGLDTPSARSGYDPDLLETGRDLAGYDPNLALAARALVDAGLVAREDDHRDLQTLNDGLVRYTRLVETARANARQNYPVDAAYLSQARGLIYADLLPTAGVLRRTGEQRMTRASNDVGGPVSATAVGLLAVALVVLGATTLVTAGRTRRLVHPGLVAATVAAAGGFVLVTAGIWSQSRELREAATDDIQAYVEANENAADLAGLRVAEITAVAAQVREEGAYEAFHEDAGRLAERLDDDALAVALATYVGEVGEVEQADDQGNRRQAAESTLTGASATSFGRAYDTSSDTVVRAQADLEDRFDSVADAGVAPAVPVGLGLLAAALAAVGIVARGRPYR